MALDLGYSIDPITLREIPHDLDSVERRISDLIVSDESKPELIGWLRMVGRLEEAREIAEGSLKSLGAEPETLGASNTISSAALTSALRYAHVLQWQGETERALAIFDRVVATSEQLFALDPPASSGRAIIAFALQHRGKCYFDIGDDVSALADFTAALSLRTLAGASAELIGSSELAVSAVEVRLRDR